MAIQLLAPLWAGNARIQRAANNNPPMQQHEGDHAAVALLQQALIQSGFAIATGADSNFLPPTANAVVAAERQFGFKTDGNAGREVFGALDLSLRGWNPPAGPHWGGLLAATIVPIAQRKIRAALSALLDIQTIKFNYVIADGVTMTALRTHFKLVIGGSRLPHEALMSDATINPLIHNFRGILHTVSNSRMIRHTICRANFTDGATHAESTAGLTIAAEAPFGGPIEFGPPYSDFDFDPDNAANGTNIDKTGPNSLAAMMMHEATHVIDNISGSDTIHISEFEVAYENQAAANARHNPSAYATFAAHIDAGEDRPRNQRFGLGGGRAL